MVDPSDALLAEVRATLEKITPGTWGLYGDPKHPEPSRGAFEAAPGLSIGSVTHTEPIARVSGYLHPVEANAALIAGAPVWLAQLCDRLETVTGERDALRTAFAGVYERIADEWGEDLEWVQQLRQLTFPETPP